MSGKRLWHVKEKTVYWIDGLSLASRLQYYLMYYSTNWSFRLVACGKIQLICLLEMNFFFFGSSNIYLKLCGKIRALFLFNKWYKGAKYRMIKVI